MRFYLWHSAKRNQYRTQHAYEYRQAIPLCVARLFSESDSTSGFYGRQDTP